jgi:sugar lactone lactonase YvrE
VPQVDLPDGFFPEGIAIGRRSTAYVGSLSDGTIYRADLKTGAGEVLTETVGQFSTVGLAVDRHNRVWAAGGVTGTARVYDGRSGDLLASYPLTGPFQSFINDVIITRDAAWFTDSGTQNSPDPAQFQFAGSPRLFKIPLDRRGGLPDPDEVEELATDVPDVAFPNLNGIETGPNGRGLIVAHTVLGALFRIDTRSGSSQQVDVDAEFVGADGLFRHGRLLYVVENGAARVAKVRLDHSGTEGTLRRLLPVEGAESPTTAAIYRGGVAYVADARFQSGTGPYQLFRLELR